VFSIEIDDTPNKVAALTHSSYYNFKYDDIPKIHKNYEILEYLGDSVIELTIRTWIVNNNFSLSLGDMNTKKIGLVNNDHLAKMFDSMGLISHIKCGPQIRNSISNRVKADIFEAWIGAIYLDHGIETASNVIMEIMNPDILSKPKKSYKEILAVLIKKVVRNEDKPIFIVEDFQLETKERIVGIKLHDLFLPDSPIFYGTATKKKLAEEIACKKALDYIGTINY
jgi:dsRNA-specific ribonuclease